MVFNEKRKAAIYFFVTFDVWKVIHLIMPSAYLKELSHEIVLKKNRQKRTDLGQKKGGDRFLNISEFLLVLYQNYKLFAVKCETYADSLCLLGFFATLTQ
jgi:hypothetical protein